MDRRGKERLIGAGILVALAVLVVPELLSGPKPVPLPAPDGPRFPAGSAAAVRNVTMDLSTSKPAVVAPASPPASQPPTPPMPPGQTAPAASSTSPPAMPSGPPQVSTLGAAVPGAGDAQPARSAAPAKNAASVKNPPPLQGSVSGKGAQPPTAGGNFAVQLGSFASRSNADNLVQQLKGQGYPVYEAAEGAGKNARYRVRVGTFPERDAAERTIAKLKAQGHAATLVSAH